MMKQMVNDEVYGETSAAQAPLDGLGPDPGCLFQFFHEEYAFLFFQQLLGKIFFIKCFLINYIRDQSSVSVLLIELA